LTPPLAQADPARIEAPDQHAAGSTTELSEIATAYFMRFTSQSKDADTTYGIHDRDGKFYIEDTEIKDGDNILVGNKVNEGKPGLRELIVSENPSDEIYPLNDKEKYTDILMSTNALRRNNDRNETYRKSSRSPKWMNLLKPIWSKYSRASKPAHHYMGSSVNKGLAPLASSHTDGIIAHKGLVLIILPSDPIALLDRLDLLFASHRAGNTGVRNEIVSIYDELRRQGVVNDSKYKYLMNLI
jgi:hypothetical protein